MIRLRLEASGKLADQRFRCNRPALVARSVSAAATSDKSEMFGSSKLGRIKDSGSETVAARFRVLAPLPRSSWTMVSRPFSNPIAFDGYQGWISFESGLAIEEFRIGDCEFRIYVHAIYR